MRLLAFDCRPEYPHRFRLLLVLGWSSRGPQSQLSSPQHCGERARCAGFLFPRLVGYLQARRKLCLRCAFLSRLRWPSVGTKCSTSPPPCPARVTRAVRRASSTLRRSGPSRRSPVLRLLLLLQFGVRFTPFRVCGPLLLTYPSLQWSVILHSAAL